MNSLTKGVQVLKLIWKNCLMVFHWAEVGVGVGRQSLEKQRMRVGGREGTMERPLQPEQIAILFLGAVAWFRGVARAGKGTGS